MKAISRLTVMVGTTLLLGLGGALTGTASAAVAPAVGTESMADTHWTNNGYHDTLTACKRGGAILVSYGAIRTTCTYDAGRGKYHLRSEWWNS